MNMTGPDREQRIRLSHEFQNPLAREVPLSRPTGAAVGRNVEQGSVGPASRTECEPDTRVRTPFDRNGRNRLTRRKAPILRGQRILRMVAILVLDRILPGIRKNHAPRASRILGAPQRLVPGINHLGIPRIEREDVDHRPQVEHTPRPRPVQSDVCAGHVAVLHHDPWIVRADGRRDHRPAAARPDDRPGIKARSGRRFVRRQGDRRQQQCEKHFSQGTLPIGSRGDHAAPAAAGFSTTSSVLSLFLLFLLFFVDPFDGTCAGG